MSELPVIDVGRLLDGKPDADVAGQIALACRDTGFFYISGHGVSSDVLRLLDAESHRFFALP